MILTDDEIKERVESPLNLLNRLRSTTRSVTHPSLPAARSNDIIDDLDDKIKIGGVRNKAAVIMAGALAELELRLPDIQKPERLAQIAVEMNKVLQTRQDEQKNPTAQIIVYAPQVREESYYETIEVKE